MTSTFLLRASSIISLLFALGHMAGGLAKWSPMGANTVLTAMSDTRFKTMGVDRSYLDFFVGFGWSIGVALVLQAVLLWQLAGLARTNGAQVRPMVAAFALSALISGLLAWRFIFPVPAGFCALLLVTLVAAFFTLR